MPENRGVEEGFRVEPPGASEVRLRGVAFSCGRDSAPVTRDLNLDIAEGEYLAVVGPSDIGESTLALLLAGLVAPDAGRGAAGGARCRNRRERNRRGGSPLFRRMLTCFAGPRGTTWPISRPTPRVGTRRGSASNGRYRRPDRRTGHAASRPRGSGDRMVVGQGHLSFQVAREPRWSCVEGRFSGWSGHVTPRPRGRAG
ncbi:ATP-binding cassette domain-containing protein [Nocardiopsis rhodophaea]|uniref:ATP-binding cassette domain-containing protein n=1 Tax=Nocardiopsis rhodophaea TaxID=280238 RepID=UPI00399D53A8